jgi:hypothetical protein
MERLDFIRKLFILYGKSTEKNIDLIRDYDLALSEEQNIDWAKMLRLVEKSDLNSLPNPKYLKSLFPKCKIEIDGQYKYDSGTGVLRLKDRFCVFDMWHTTHTIEEITRNFKNKYEGNFVSFKYYPENFKIIGRNIFDTSSGKMELHEVIQ